MPISNSEIALVKQLHAKKYRKQHQLVVVEGPKIISELLEKGIKPTKFWATENIILTHNFLTAEPIGSGAMQKISTQKSPAGALALLDASLFETLWQKRKTTNLRLFLDGIQDPGNLGTIIRTADWFGVDAIYANIGTADIENQKVIQASMGSVFNVPFHYITNQEDFVEQHKNDFQFYATHLQGEDINRITLVKPAIICIGNESKGLNEFLTQACDKKIKIPNFGAAESLNAAVATGIVLAGFNRE
ncbi:MAG: TrmH family RNA methyltransferase [Luteibaculaceae bacterium]